MSGATTLAAQFEIRTRYRRSVNLERDAHDPNILEGYVLTPLAKKTLARMADALKGETAQRAWTITGPYGSGKSAFQVLLYSLLCGSNERAHKAAKALLQKSAPELAKELHAKGHVLGMGGLVPIILTGERGRLDDALVRALERGLRTFWAGPGAKPEVLIRLQDWVHKFSKGKRPAASEIVEAVEDAAHKVASSRNGAAGLFIAVDELGKFLEHAAFSPSEGDLYLLQALAESACRTKDARVLFVTSLHQGFDRYASRLGHVQRNEWSKVQGRFEDVAFQEAPEQLLRLVGEAIQDKAPESWSRSNYKKLADKAAQLVTKQVAIAEPTLAALLSQCAPLHPATALALGPVFRGQAAQNERSLFAFLASAEPQGFQSFLKGTSFTNKDAPTYRLPELYDYLVANLGMALNASAQGKRWSEIEATLQRLDPGAPAVDARVLKTVGLLSTLGTSSAIVGSPEFLAFALEGQDGVTRRDVDDALKRLTASSLIIFRRYKNAYQLWEGSDLDVESLLALARGKIGALPDLAAELQRLHPAQPVIAKRHLFKTGTFRFFEVRYLNASKVLEAEGPLLKDEPEDADGLLIYALPADESESAALKKVVASPQFWFFRLSAHRLPMVVAVPDEIAQIREALQELAAIELVRLEAAGLDADQVARRELAARQQEAKAFLQRQVEAMFGLASKNTEARCQFFVEGEAKDAPKGRRLSPRGVSNLLSDLCDRRYDRAPIIHNELLNREVLSSSAASARRVLVEAMVEAREKPGLGFEGNPPEKAMYRALLERHGLHRKVGDTWMITEPLDTVGGLGPAWRRMEDLLTEAEGRRLSVDDLFNGMAAPPFGLKRGVLPVLLTAVLIHLDSEVALYEEKVFVPQLTAAVLERLMRAPERFEVQRSRIEGARAQVLERFANAYLGKRSPGRTDLVRIIRRLAVFMQDLPNHAKLTKRLSKQAMDVREALQMATEPAQLMFQGLPKAVGLPTFEPETPKSDANVDAFFKALRTSLVEIEHVYDQLLADLSSRMAASFLLPVGADKLRSELSARATRVMQVAVDLKLKSFLARAADTELDDRDWLVALATNLAGKPPEQWADPDLDAFSAKLALTAEQVRSFEALIFGSKQEPATALRLAVLTPGAPERSAVVHATPDDLVRVQAAEDALEQQLRVLGLRDRRDLALRALAQLAERLLKDEQPPSKPEVRQ